MMPSDLVLPGLERRVVEQELEDVADGVLGRPPGAPRVLVDLVLLRLA